MIKGIPNKEGRLLEFSGGLNLFLGHSDHPSGTSILMRMFGFMAFDAGTLERWLGCPAEEVVGMREVTESLLGTERYGSGVCIVDANVLSWSKGFLSLHRSREVPHSFAYASILILAYRPPLRQVSPEMSAISSKIDDYLGGEMIVSGEAFYLVDKVKRIPAVMCTPGQRMLGLLSILIKNGSIGPGNTLIMDRPEAGLTNHDKRVVAEVISAIAATQQVHLATEDGFMLREFAIQNALSEDEGNRFSVFCLNGVDIFRQTTLEGCPLMDVDASLDQSERFMDLAR